MQKIVILVSGGLDSSTLLAMLASNSEYQIHALSFNYGQNHVIELDCIKKMTQHYKVHEHRTINLDLSAFATSALINKQLDVPHYNDAKDIGSEIPITYVPARNTIFLSYALGYAEVIGASDIYIGTHKTDSANYPDCRLEYLQSFEKMANLATKMGIEGSHIKINAPLIGLSKSQIVSKGLELGVPYEYSISCYDPSIHGHSCGKCHACLVRIDAFAANGKHDPIKYI
jgi:7-cyano-7-deazaguanine synthase